MSADQVLVLIHDLSRNTIKLDSHRLNEVLLTGVRTGLIIHAAERYHKPNLARAAGTIIKGMPGHALKRPDVRSGCPSGMRSRDTLPTAPLCPGSCQPVFNGGSRTRPCACFGREKGARGRLRRHPLIYPIFSPSSQFLGHRAISAPFAGRNLHLVAPHPPLGLSQSERAGSSGAQPLFLQYSIVNSASQWAGFYSRRPTSSSRGARRGAPESWA
jgi:hypothetical protein